MTFTNTTNKNTKTKFTKFNCDEKTQKQWKREQKMQAKEIECMIENITTNITENSCATGENTTNEEEEEEEGTAAKTANIKIFKITETEDNTGFSTTSSEISKNTNETSNQNFVRTCESNPSIAEFSNAYEFIATGESLVALFGGKLMSTETQNGRGGSKGLRFSCNNNHEFTITFAKLKKAQNSGVTVENCKNIWCVKCHNFYFRCVKRAQDNGAAVKSSIFNQRNVIVVCRNNHEFKLSIHRSPEKTWCHFCKKERKKEEIKQLKIEREIREQNESEIQKKLFEESRKHIHTEKLSQSDEANKQTKIAEILNQVHFMATKKTEEFLMTIKAQSGDSSSIYQMFKILFMPNEILISSFASLGATAHSAFRKLSVQIHPDKNVHPLSKQAFQKLAESFHASLPKAS